MTRHFCLGGHVVLFVAASRMPRAGRGQKKKNAVLQVSLEEVNMLPLLKKPLEMIGKEVLVPGSHWGDSCTNARDKNRKFVCVVMDFCLTHRFEQNETPCTAFKLHEMGVDGTGGNSEPFWMKYPMPFLTFYYETFPDELQQRRTAVPPAQQGAQEDRAEGAEAEVVVEAPHSNKTDEDRTSTIIYSYLKFVTTKSQGGKSVACFTCTVGKCGASVTIHNKSTGPFFKHVRRKAATGCEKHAAVLEELNMSSCRQVIVIYVRTPERHMFASAIACFIFMAVRHLLSGAA